MQCYTGHKLVPNNTDWPSIERITGRKARGEAAGGNKLQATDVVSLLSLSLYTHTHTPKATHTHTHTHSGILLKRHL